MSDILIIPDHAGCWTLGLRKGVVVRLPWADAPGLAARVRRAIAKVTGLPISDTPRPTVRTGRIRLALACHCGDQTDNPADLARMRAVYAREEAMNG